MAQDREGDIEPVADSNNNHLSGLLKGLIGDLSTLIRLEIALAKAEMKEKAVSMAVASGLLVAAAFFGLLAVAVLTATIVISISVALPAWLAALIVTCAYLLLAVVLALVGIHQIPKSKKSAPGGTVESAGTATTKEGTS